MFNNAESFEQGAPCEVSEQHLAITGRIAAKYKNMQPDSHLYDEIDSAASLGLTNAYNYYEISRLTDALITTCVKNAILNALKRKANSAILPYEAETVNRTSADAWEEVVDTDDMVDIKMQRERLAELLSLLPNELRKIVALLHSEEEYSQAEIAMVFGVAQSTISKRYKEAIQMLRDAAAQRGFRRAA